VRLDHDQIGVLWRAAQHFGSARSHARGGESSTLPGKAKLKQTEFLACANWGMLDKHKRGEESMSTYKIEITASITGAFGGAWFTVQIKNSAAWVLSGSGFKFNVSSSSGLPSGTLTSETFVFGVPDSKEAVMINTECCLETEEPSVSLHVSRAENLNLNIRSPVDGHVSQGGPPFEEDVVLRLI
jgi:hypothetical protein